MSVHDEVLAAAKDMLRLNLTAGTSGNVSGRIDDNHVVITPSSIDYETMTLADLVVLDMAGEVVEGTRSPSSEKLVHLASYRRYSEVGSVIHAHPPYASMFAVARLPIPAVIDEFAVFVGGDVPCAEYAMTGTPELGELAADCLADVGSALLANHGTVTVAGSPAAGIHQLGVVERAAQIVWGARALGNVAELPETTNATLSSYYKMIRARPVPAQ
jgi:L-fuculose-phosphate aldolase